ncbi:alkaline ceramidase 3-like [Anneissia japonica]|uniref:alkaline ceramidase 3-like n=1 Tax=Anneissia japonica TaxID=1529436 RepID=UPI0014258A67|nr:alkaline ceramidase 3-like [Anneissia japonica]
MLFLLQDGENKYIPMHLSTESQSNSVEGYWGNPTSTIDWCEDDYAVSFYIAEFWNTLTNLGIIIPAVLGLIAAIQDKVEPRTVLGYLALLAVGIGSWCFHMTLQFHMQLLDELPMIWGCCIFLYCLVECTSAPKSHNLILGVMLLLCAVVITVVYVVFKIPSIFQISFGVLAISMIIKSINYLRTTECAGRFFYGAITCYALGTICWCLDYSICPSLQYFREVVPAVFRPLLQLHGWWHICAGLGISCHILFIYDIRCHYLQQKHKVKRFLGVVPYMRVENPRPEKA